MSLWERIAQWRAIAQAERAEWEQMKAEAQAESALRAARARLRLATLSR